MRPAAIVTWKFSLTSGVHLVCSISRSFKNTSNRRLGVQSTCLPRGPCALRRARPLSRTQSVQSSDWRQRIRDVLDAIREIQAFTQDMDAETFASDRKTLSAVAYHFIV